VLGELVDCPGAPSCLAEEGPAVERSRRAGQANGITPAKAFVTHEFIQSRQQDIDARARGCVSGRLDRAKLKLQERAGGGGHGRLGDLGFGNQARVLFQAYVDICFATERVSSAPARSIQLVPDG
jgi:hypothetical protein